jgi:hypothetical protein
VSCAGCIQTHHLPRHPNYLSDADADWDSTYANTLFSIPVKHAAECAAMHESSVRRAQEEAAEERRRGDEAAAKDRAALVAARTASKQARAWQNVVDAHAATVRAEARVNACRGALARATKEAAKCVAAEAQLRAASSALGTRVEPGLTASAAGGHAAAAAAAPSHRP